MVPQELANGVTWVGILPGAVGLPGPAPVSPTGPNVTLCAGSLCLIPRIDVVYLLVTKVTLQTHASPGRDSRSTGLDFWTFPVH